MARPTSYKPEYAEIAFRLCLLGLTDEELARHFGHSRSTLALWKEKIPEFSDALKDGREDADSKIAQSLYLKALNGDTTAMIFWLKNRHVKKWRANPEDQQNDSEIANALREIAKNLPT